MEEKHRELETEKNPPEERYFCAEENFNEEEEMVLADEFSETNDLDRQVVYYLAGFSTFREKLNRKLCADCQEIFFPNKVMREFFIPLTQLTQSRDRGGLDYVGVDVHHFFCDLEKVIRHFFQANRMPTWINSPAGQLKTRSSQTRVHELFMENEYFQRDRKTCPCDWMKLSMKLS